MAKDQNAKIQKYQHIKRPKDQMPEKQKAKKKKARTLSPKHQKGIT